MLAGCPHWRFDASRGDAPGWEILPFQGGSVGEAQCFYGRCKRHAEASRLQIGTRKT